MSYLPIQIDRHTNVYRGFEITEERDTGKGRNRYRITLMGDYFGIEFSFNAALRFVDELQDGRQ